MTEEEQVRIWDAINAYATACGGDVSGATITEHRMLAVCAVENVLLDLTQQRVIDATTAVERIRSAVSDVWEKGARQARRLLDENQRLLRERDQLAYENSRFRHAARNGAKQYGVNIDDLRAWVLKRSKLKMRDPSLKQGYEYARTLLAVFEGVSE
jgi:cell division protein FtsL